MPTPDPLSSISLDDLGAWLRLLETPGIGRTTARRLLAAYGSPQAVLQAAAADARPACDKAALEALKRPPPHIDALAQQSWQWLHAAPDRAILVLGDPLYPQPLLETPDAPLVLYAAGRLDTLGRPAIAVVGSRNPTAQGADNARAFSRALGAAGLVVVSGLALGVDSAAHAGALEAAAAGGAGTIAVVGTGLDRVYPSRNRELAHRVVQHGLLLSEFPLGTPPLPPNFPMRNRIIAGLSLGTLVVEAALQSGSLITARQAADCGRDVFAIPGSIHSPLSRGCHELIRQGAKLVESTDHILEELRLARPDGGAASPRTGPSDSGEPADPLLRAMGFDPISLEQLQLRTDEDMPNLSVRLLTLEMSGDIARLPGGRVQRVVRA